MDALREDDDDHDHDEHDAKEEQAGSDDESAAQPQVRCCVSDSSVA